MQASTTTKCYDERRWRAPASAMQVTVDTPIFYRDGTPRNVRMNTEAKLNGEIDVQPVDVPSRFTWLMGKTLEDPDSTNRVGSKGCADIHFVFSSHRSLCTGKAYVEIGYFCGRWRSVEMTEDQIIFWPAHYMWTADTLPKHMLFLEASSNRYYVTIFKRKRESDVVRYNVVHKWCMNTGDERDWTPKFGGKLVLAWRFLDPGSAEYIKGKADMEARIAHLDAKAMGAHDKMKVTVGETDKGKAEATPNAFTEQTTAVVEANAGAEAPPEISTEQTTAADEATEKAEPPPKVAPGHADSARYCTLNHNVPDGITAGEHTGQTILKAIIGFELTVIDTTGRDYIAGGHRDTGMSEWHSWTLCAANDTFRMQHAYFAWEAISELAGGVIIFRPVLNDSSYRATHYDGYIAILEARDLEHIYFTYYRPMTYNSRTYTLERSAKLWPILPLDLQAKLAELPVTKNSNTCISRVSHTEGSLEMLVEQICNVWQFQAGVVYADYASPTRIPLLKEHAKARVERDARHPFMPKARHPFMPKARHPFMPKPMQKAVSESPPAASVATEEHASTTTTSPMPVAVAPTTTVSTTTHTARLCTSLAGYYRLVDPAQCAPVMFTGIGDKSSGYCLLPMMEVVTRGFNGGRCGGYSKSGPIASTGERTTLPKASERTTYTTVVDCTATVSVEANSYCHRRWTHDTNFYAGHTRMTSERTVTYDFTLCDNPSVFATLGNGELYACGNNRSGQLGCGSKAPHHVAKWTKVNFGPDTEHWLVEKVVTGIGFTLVLVRDPRIKKLTIAICGACPGGDVGVDKRFVHMWHLVPVIPGKTDVWFAGQVYYMLVGDSFCIVELKGPDGVDRMITWGGNSFGQLGHDGSHPFACTPHGITLDDPNVHIVHASTGARHAALVDSDHKVWVWGANDMGQCGIPSSGFSVFRPTRAKLRYATASVHCGDWFTCVLDVYGNIHTAGNNQSGQLACHLPTNTHSEFFNPACAGVVGKDKGAPVLVRACRSTMFVVLSTGAVHCCGASTF